MPTSTQRILLLLAMTALAKRWASLVVLTALLIGSPIAHAARQALVIGNAAYTEGALKNPVNDARAIDAKLTALGFKVMKVENLKRQQIGRTLSAFANGLKPGDEVVVFYAGHGVQVKGINYLPAVDADIQSEEDVALNSLNLNSLMERLDEAKAGLKLLFLDACRNNPYARSMRSGDRGLARISAAPSGTLIHFATRPGSVAADGSGSNGLYTTQLLRFIDSADIPVETMLKRVSAAVTVESKRQQEPWTEGSIIGEFYFRSGGAAQAANPEPVANDAQIEQQAWNAAQSGNTAAGYEAYLEEYPRGRFSAAARVARASLGVAVVLAPPLTMAPVNPAQTSPPPSIVSAQELAAGAIIKDCADCPEMVMIPAGSFEMGSAESGNEKPVHRVKLSAFLLGRTEVTQGQWQAVMGSNPSDFKQCGADCPVEKVSWNDAQEFAKKLSAKTGKTYRLPSESEWEFAARAGSSGLWSFGDEESQLAAHAWYGRPDFPLLGGSGGNSDRKTHAVAQKKPNAFGLYDMHGNVWEWVEDAYHENYQGAPADGSAWISGGDQARRGLRGGAYVGLPKTLASTYRNRSAPHNANSQFGFRIARTL